jgi:phenylpropionate dioxygenase-like ring-hydroxylating dioxygenase large terminal subunit
MTQTGTIFRAQDLERMRRPLEQAAPPPAYYYTSPELYELEVRNIFLKEWLWVGHVEQVQQPGDYFTFTVVNEPLVVVRDHGGELRAFSAVCRHRGAVVAAGAGNCKAFSCPYHSWTYALSGKLIGAPEMEKVQGFDATQYGLIPLKVETWEGIIFVNFDPQSQPLAASLGDLPEYVKNYKLGEMVCTERREYDFPCNWKMLVENATEGYHLPGTHHTSEGTEYGALQNWTVKAEPQGLYDDLIFTGSEAVTMSVPGSVDKVAATIAGLTPTQQREHHFLLLYPNQLLVFQPDSVLCFVMLPEGPAHVKVIVDWHFPKPLVEGPGFAEIAKANYDGVEGFNDQDIHVLGLTYQGYQSRLFRPGRFSLHERIPHRFAHYILNRVLEEEAFAS